jgi:hypothetical protein
MARRSTVRRVEEFILFDVLYEDGGLHSSIAVGRKLTSMGRSAA